VAAPVNVRLQTPTAAIPDWNHEAAKWTNLNTAAGGDPGFYPLTVKAAYVVGLEHDICESVSHLLKHPRVETTTFIPAYGVFASGVELLGRCINGDRGTSGSSHDLKTGFKWLVSPSYNTVSDNDVVITTSDSAYTVEMLAALRHFAAHGQATSGIHQFGSIDHGILAQMPPLIADGLERYWSELQRDESLCNKLAEANIVGLRNWPVFRSWMLFEKDKSGKYPSITEIFNRFDWRV
jgi:hypothetical protein